MSIDVIDDDPAADTGRMAEVASALAGIEDDEVEEEQESPLNAAELVGELIFFRSKWYTVRKVSARQSEAEPVGGGATARIKNDDAVRLHSEQAEMRAAVDAFHARPTLARPSEVPRTVWKDSAVLASRPDCTRDLIASAGARSSEPNVSPSAPASRYTSKG